MCLAGGYGDSKKMVASHLGENQQEKKDIIEMRSFLWNISFIIVGLIFVWMWKDSRGPVITYIVYYIVYCLFLEIVYAVLMWYM